MAESVVVTLSMSRWLHTFQTLLMYYVQFITYKTKYFITSK